MIAIPKFTVGVRSNRGRILIFPGVQAPSFEEAALCVAREMNKHTPDMCPVTILTLIPGGKP
jgi:hypothetical protein